MKKYKSVEACFKACGLNPNNLPDVAMLPIEMQKPVIDHYKLMIVAKAHNGDWKPDWNDWSQRKYYPWFDVIEDESTSSGSGLAYDDYANTDTVTVVGSRLCFVSRELAEHAGKTFIGLYNNYFLYNN